MKVQHSLVPAVAIILTVLFVAVFTFSLSAQPDENTSVTDLVPETIAPIKAPFEMPQLKRPVFPDHTFNIKDFGAVEGGKVKITDAVKKAIEAAGKVGGGKVIIPEGTWLTGPIHLKSHINLYVAEGAEVRFSTDFKDYLPAVFSRHNGMECYKVSALLYANGCENIAITGKGRFHGQGKIWRENAQKHEVNVDGKKGLEGGGVRLSQLAQENAAVKDRVFDGSRGDFLRPAFVHPINCKNVLIEGVTFMYGPQWTIQPTYCENVIVRGVRVITKGDYGSTPNGDGVNPDSCKNVLIEYCDMDTGDDCFAIKSGRAEDGLRVGRPCENIVIRHSQGRRGHGGVVIGSETSGGIRNVFIHDCTFNGTDRGLRYKTARGRGATIENIWASDIKMGTIRKEAIIVNTLRYTKRYPAHPLSDRTPTYRNLHFRNITCEYSKKSAIRIIGLPEKAMGDLTFENITIKGAEGIRVQDAGNVKFVNVQVIPDKGPVILLDECFDITIENTKCPKGADPYLQLIGKKTKNIKMKGVDLTAAKTKVVTGVSVPPATLADSEPSGLVGRWDFDDGTGKDLSGNDNDAVLGGVRIHSLGKGHSCLQIVPDAEPMRIPASPDSPLAISRGTVCLWLSAAWVDSANVLVFDNDAVQFRYYRRHFQPRFSGEDDFKYSSGILDYDWPKYDMREWAFYPHVRAAVGDSQWHHFAVAYDDQSKRIIGWRDGEQISIVDLSTVAMEPLVREDLEAIVTGDEFAGYIDDIRIYNRVLTDADMRKIFNATKSVYEGRYDTIPTDKEMDVYKYQKEDHTLYQAWLQYNPGAPGLGESLFKHIVAEGSNSTVQTAAAELSDAIESMFDFKPSVRTKPPARRGSKVVLGTAETSSWIRDRADKLELDRIKNDGFIIKAVEDGSPGAPGLVIAGNVPAGVIFGTFELIRRIQLGQDPRELDVLENPRIPIRMVDHWAYFRGFKGDKWRGGGRSNSIYSWEELRTGDTKLIRDWVRMMSSAGWNAICPSEVNWCYRNNFLEHLDEVEILAGICRDYGITLYWSPSYLLALEKATADKLYSRVPDFGGYMLKLGSEKQNGDPRPPMVNRIADNLKPYGGYTLVRAFVYGNSRYTPEPYRNLIPHDIFAPEDGNFRDNVIIIPKGSPLDWDFAAPIPALDGAMQKNLSGSEMVIDKGWPVSWIEKWKWWLEQDNYRKGPGSLNKFDVDCIMGVSMISPSPAWTECPLNMVNYYGLGRLAWNPNLSVDEIYTEWIRLTFGDDPDVLDDVKTILLMSDDVTRKLYMYRGYRGIWLDTGEDNMVQGKTPHTVSRKGIGVTSPELRKRLLNQYAPGLREIYGDRIKGEEFLPYFHFVDYDYRLSNGRTVIQDIYANLDEAVKGAEKMPEIWKRLEGKIDQHRFQYTLDNLTHYIETASKTRNKMVKCFEEKTGRKYIANVPFNVRP